MTEKRNIADRSGYRWPVVAEYEADELAFGSEDDKIEKAQRSAKEMHRRKGKF